MELSQKIESLLKLDEDGFFIANGRNYITKIKQNRQKDGLKLLTEIINIFGGRSAKSQNLKQVITTIDKFSMTDQRIYIKISQNKVLGFVKVGEKNLFYRDYLGAIKQVKPTCVLDIYVHQSCQRNGIGKEIFEKFIKSQDKLPEKLAYDRPSQKLIGFLKKHYNLVKYIPQNNNFVIFDRYFDNKIEKPKSSLEIFRKTKVQQFPDSLEMLKRNTYKMSSQPKQIFKIDPPLTSKQSKEDSLKITSLKAVSQFPWIIGSVDRKNLRTTSNTYGSHYNLYK